MNPDNITSELRDIKPLIEISEPSALSPYVILGIVLIAVLLSAAVAWLIYRRRNRTAETDPVSDAIRELDTARALLVDASSEAYAISISNVVRRYLERHLGTSAVRQTSDEFLASLASQKGGILQIHRDSLREFLRLCDLAKFSKGELAHEQREILQTAAREFIEATSAPATAEQKCDPATMPQTPALA